jgi:hypothetical protein
VRDGIAQDFGRLSIERDDPGIPSGAKRGASYINQILL